MSQQYGLNILLDGGHINVLPLIQITQVDHVGIRVDLNLTLITW